MAEEWRWSSLWRRRPGTAQHKSLLSECPLPKPRQWRRLVNQPQTDAELQALRRCVNRGQPYGSQTWIARVVQNLGLESTIRLRGRPKKQRD